MKHWNQQHLPVVYQFCLGKHFTLCYYGAIVEGICTLCHNLQHISADSWIVDITGSLTTSKEFEYGKCESIPVKFIQSFESKLAEVAHARSRNTNFLFKFWYILQSSVGLIFFSTPTLQNLNLPHPAPAWVWEILPAPVPHISNPHTPHRPPQFMPAPHFSGLKPAPLWKLLKTHN